MKSRQQSSTSYPINFLMIDSADHITGKATLTVTVTISKNGGAFGAASGAVTEIANGWYSLAGNATDRNTLGEFLIHATATGADPFDEKYEIISSESFALAYPTNFSVLAIAATTGQVGLDFSNIKQATGATTLTNITVPVTTSVTNDVGITQAGADKAWATTTRILTAGTNIALAKGTGVTGFNDISVTDIWGAATRTITGTVTVGTNNDKTGYSLTQAFPANFSSMAIASGTGQVGLDFSSIKQATTPTTLTDITVPNVTNVLTDVGITQAGADRVWASTSRSLTSSVTISQSFPANFSSLAIAATGQVGLDFTNINQATGATTLTNITVPTVTNVTNDVGITQAGANKAWATTTRVLTAGTNIALAKGTGVTGFNDIDVASVWAAGTRTLTAFSFTVVASNMISDYQQRGVAVTLPTTVPSGYGASIDTSALAGAILSNPSNKLVTNSSGAVLLPQPPPPGYSGGSGDTFIDPGVTVNDTMHIH
jgi:uncharacterized membrane protein